MIAVGEFDVNLQPLDTYGTGQDGTTLGHMSIDKTFRGDLDAVSQGEMLTAMTRIQGSAGYVAVEQVRGTLHGKRGTFVLQHFGVMEGAENRLILDILPDSGTGELEGLRGSMQISIEDGTHRYKIDYLFG